MLTHRPTPASRMGRPDNGTHMPYGYSPQYFGGKVFHNGQDYYWLDSDREGTQKVFACGKGRVSNVFWSNAMGWCVEIIYDAVPGVVFRSCHMAGVSVTKNSPVDHTTYLGPMGGTGTAAAGAVHLHFEAWRGLNRVDPERYFGSTADDGTTPIDLGDEELDMSSTKYLWVKDLGDGQGAAYGIFGEQVPGGSRVTRSVQTAQVWGAMFGKEGDTDFGAPWKELTRTQWSVAVREAKVINEAWRAQFTTFEFDYQKLGEAFALAVAALPPQTSADEIASAVAGKIPQPTARPFAITLTGEANPT